MVFIDIQVSLTRPRGDYGPADSRYIVEMTVFVTSATGVGFRSIKRPY